MWLGWCSGSYANEMLIYNEQRDRLLIFSGEEFPEPGIADRLRGRGHAVKAEGPSYLIHLAEDESNFPKSLNGLFHGVLVDQAKGMARLFNDRFGMHRLYFHEAGNAFYFAAAERRRFSPSATNLLIVD